MGTVSLPTHLSRPSINGFSSLGQKKRGPNSKPTKKTKAQAGSSNHTTSTPAWPSSTKSKSIMERNSEVANIKEQIAQKQMELKKFQVKSTNDIAVAISSPRCT